MEICDGTVCVISSNKDDISHLNTINVSGRMVRMCYFVGTLSTSGSIGDHDDVKKCLKAAPKLLLTIRTLLTSV